MIAWLVILALATVSGAAQTHGQATYAAVFDAGLRALERGERSEAAEHFLTAGRLAPDAALWRVYRAHAQGSAFEFEPAESGVAWSPARATRHRHARWSPDGLSILEGDDPAALRDVRTGAWLQQLETPEGPGRSEWSFDASGRWLVRTNDHDQPMQVRDARTGEPVRAKLLAGLGAPRVARVRWLEPGRDEPVPGLGEVTDVPLAGGTLRVWTPPRGLAREFTFGSGGTRAFWHCRGEPGTLELFDVADGKRLAEARLDCEVAGFSPDGRWLLGLGPEQMVVLDAATGERCPGPSDVAASPLASRTFAVAGSRLFLIEGTGRVLEWDMEEQRAVREFELAPDFRSVTGGSVWLGSEPAVVRAGRLLVNGHQTLHVYDLATGRELWSSPDLSGALGSALAPDGREVLLWAGGRIRRVDVASGVASAEVRLPPEPGYGGVALDGDALLVSCSDGSLRRIDLASGSTTAEVLAAEAGGSEDMVRLPDAIATWSRGETLSVWSTPSLTLLARTDLRADERVLALSEDGSRAVVGGWDGRPRILHLANGEASIEPNGMEGPGRAATFSSDGRRVACTDPIEVGIFDSATGERLMAWPHAHGRNVGPMTWYGDDRLVVGWGTQEDKVGLDLIEVSDGRRLAHLFLDSFYFGGSVSAIVADLERDRLTYSAVSTGIVASFSGPDWGMDWSLDFGGGNPSDLRLEHASPSRRLHVSGMMDSVPRIVERDTGAVLAAEAVHGLYDLHGSADDRFVFGRREGRLMVLRGEDFAPLYERGEGLDGSAWIQRGKAYALLPGPQGQRCSAFLVRDGRSLPTDCWDAWLHDPLGLRPASLSELPEPPTVVAGPPRLVKAAGPSVEFELTVSSTSEVLGLEVEVPGRGASFWEVAQAQAEGPVRLSVELDGPWPADVELRAVSRNGTRTAPWLVRVE